jgi:hypothetical protein
VKTVLFLGTRGYEVIPGGQQRGQALHVGSFGSLRGRGVGGAVGRQDLSVETVGLCENAARTGKIADLTRIDDTAGNGMLVEIIDQGVLITASGFTYDVGESFALQGQQAGFEFGESRRAIGKAEGLILETKIDGGLGDISTDVDNGYGHGL